MYIPQQLKLLILLKAGITKAVKSLAIYEKAVTLPSELFKGLLSLIKISVMMEEKNEQQGMRIVSDEELQQVSGGVVIRRQR